MQWDPSWCTAMRCNGHKFKLGKICWDIKKSFFLLQERTVLVLIVQRSCAVSVLGAESPSSLLQPDVLRVGERTDGLWRSLPSYAFLWLLDTLTNIFAVLGANAKYIYIPDLYFCKEWRSFIVISAYGEILNISNSTSRAALVARDPLGQIPCKHLSSAQLTYSHPDLHQPRIPHSILRLNKWMRFTVNIPSDIVQLFLKSPKIAIFPGVAL